MFIGASGTGKSHTSFGKKELPGIVQMLADWFRNSEISLPDKDFDLKQFKPGINHKNEDGKKVVVSMLKFAGKNVTDLLSKQAVTVLISDRNKRKFTK